MLRESYFASAWLAWNYVKSSPSGMERARREEEAAAVAPAPVAPAPAPRETPEGIPGDPVLEPGA